MLQRVILINLREFAFEILVLCQVIFNAPDSESYLMGKIIFRSL